MQQLFLSSIWLFSEGKAEKQVEHWEINWVDDEGEPWWKGCKMEKGILVKGKPKFPLNLNQNAPVMLKINKASNISIIKRERNFGFCWFSFLWRWWIPAPKYPWGISFSFSNKSLRFSSFYKLLMDIKIKFNTFFLSLQLTFLSFR